MGEGNAVRRKEELRRMMMPISADARADTNEDERRPVRSHALRSMGLSLQALSDEAGEAQRLRRQIEGGETVVEIPPDLVDPSFVRDRLTDNSTVDIEDLTDSIAAHGQQVPILVRPHPEKEGRYQAAYGHRRVEALRRLDRPVRAVVRTMSDLELIIAQGKENLDRRDLSFIERALFAARLEDLGFDRSALTAVLSVHKGNLSTMITIVRSIPTDLVLAIGPSPKIGRPRWEQLGEALRAPSATAIARAATASPAFQVAGTDDRFSIVWRALQPERKAPPSLMVAGQGGKPLARVDRAGDSVRLTIKDGETSAFGTYLVTELPNIYEAFKRRVNA